MKNCFRRLKRTFFCNHPKVVAPKLLGKYIIRTFGKRRIVAKIVETEAYDGEKDKACHISRFGKTKRTATLFEKPGKAYVYPVHIKMYCLNVVAHKKREAGGVLIRALEPVEGIEIILKNLNLKKFKYEKLLSGPAKLCKALKINTSLLGEDLVEGKKLYITYGTKLSKNLILSTPRINIPYAAESKNWKWRFIIKNSKFLSR
jgi:DNA-3-methyladenine glycosylase